MLPDEDVLFEFMEMWRQRGPEEALKGVCSLSFLVEVDALIPGQLCRLSIPVSTERPKEEDDDSATEDEEEDEEEEERERERRRQDEGKRKRRRGRPRMRISATVLGDGHLAYAPGVNSELREERMRTLRPKILALEPVFELPVKEDKNKKKRRSQRPAKEPTRENERRWKKRSVPSDSADLPMRHSPSRGEEVTVVTARSKNDGVMEWNPLCSVVFFYAPPDCEEAIAGRARRASGHEIVVTLASVVVAVLGVVIAALNRIGNRDSEQEEAMRLVMERTETLALFRHSAMHRKASPHSSPSPSRRNEPIRTRTLLHGMVPYLAKTGAEVSTAEGQEYAVLTDGNFERFFFAAPSHSPPSRQR